MMIEPVVPPGAWVTDQAEWEEARKLACDWLQKAHKAVVGAFPGIDFSRSSPEIQKAQEKLQWYIWAFWYSKTATMSDVQESWRSYYRLFLPTQEETK